jgi:hypothetical protein
VTVATFDDLDPYSAGVMPKIAEGAFGAWSLARPPERQRVFLAAADVLGRRSD